MHFGGWFFENSEEAEKKLIELGNEYGVNIIIGYDGMEIDVDEVVKK